MRVNHERVETLQLLVTPEIFDSIKYFVLMAL